MTIFEFANSVHKKIKKGLKTPKLSDADIKKYVTDVFDNAYLMCGVIPPGLYVPDKQPKGWMTMKDLKRTQEEINRINAKIAKTRKELAESKLVVEDKCYDAYYVFVPHGVKLTKIIDSCAPDSEVFVICSPKNFNDVDIVPQGEKLYLKFKDSKSGACYRG